MRKSPAYDRLDRIDFAILEALQEDGRLTNKELAARVHLAPSSVLERVRRLRADGVIRSFHAVVDPAALGIGIQALVAVHLRDHASGQVETFREHMLAQREVLAVYYLAGATDFRVHVAVSDTEHLRTFCTEVVTAHHEIRHVETSLIFDHASTPRLPNYAGERSASAAP